MTFKQAVLSVFRNYFNFRDRAPRSEFWWYLLFCLLLGFVCGLVDYFAFGVHDDNQIGPTGAIANLATLVPSIAVTARRLHDVGRSGWWMLAVLTVVGIIPLVYWYGRKGDTGRNRFGEDPLSFYTPGRRAL